ncbi:uncharacterized protein VICG_00534 [Vittaforma corneae ATCC 50505]|uniref:Protein-tyrosine phosphatase n=1 Tax=Vittaforma corneae (strain ATCC 50505) TaxID=993615 RepID=L2GPJ8_VITCO|nr:uncharacterized protein VICG_00534 [Vittaforma corneae ATCC 50505]ELA42435.1 hypothetical protein VICG_00534 [Vittaforma corneae ATCC 50505]
MFLQSDRSTLFDTSKLVKLIKHLKTRQYQRFMAELDLSISFSRRALHPYDRYRDVTPYDESVADKYKLKKYINASFIILNGDYYIACQEPKLTFGALFVEFLLKCDAEYLICLEKNLHYLKGYQVLESKAEMLDETEFLIDQIYKIENRTIRVIKCSMWKDHGVLERKQMEELWKYTLDIPKDKLKIIHCKAGVGRTGTFIMFRILKDIQRIGEVVTPEKFVDVLVELRKQRTLMVQNDIQLKFLAEYFIEEKFFMDKVCEASD